MIAEKFFNQYGGYTREEMLETAVEFAQACVQEALVVAANKAKMDFTDGLGGEGTKNVGIVKSSILGAYSPHNIKIYEI